MSIADASLTIERLEAEVQRELDERYAFYRMLHATDRVLWRLEGLNKDGVRDLPADVGLRMHNELAGLPDPVRAELRDGTVQAALDGVFAAQDALLALHVPGYERDTGEEDIEAPADLSERIVAMVVKHPGAVHSQLVRWFASDLRDHAARRLPQLVAEGRLRAVEGRPAKPGPKVTRYWVEAGGGE